MHVAKDSCFALQGKNVRDCGRLHGLFERALGAGIFLRLSAEKNLAACADEVLRPSMQLSGYAMHLRG